eukprot:101808_1
MEYFQHYNASNFSCSNNNCTVQKKGNDSKTCYGSKVIKYNDTGIHRWKIQIHKVQSTNGCVICIDEACYKWKNNSLAYNGQGTSHYGYSSNGNKFNPKCKETSYGDKYKAGDVVEVVLDLDKKTVGFALNNSIISEPAFTVNPTDIGYALAVNLYHDGDSVTLISYNHTKTNNLTETKTNE